MQCHDICENLSAYIDGMLDQQVASLVEQHLETCTGCRTEYEDLLAVIELVRELPEVEPPTGFRDDLRKRLLSGVAADGFVSEPKPATRRLVGKRWVGLVAAAAVIFLTVGVAALWYDDQGLMLSPGKGNVTKESQVAHNEVDNQANDVDDNIMALRVTDGANELRTGSAPAPEVAPQTGIQKSSKAPSDLKFQSSPDISGDGTKGPMDAGTSGQPEGEEEFSIMALPGTESGESQQFIPALTEEERAARDTAPRGLGGGPSQAVEYSVVLQVYDRQETTLKVSKMVENHGGFIEPQQDKVNNYMLITVPFYNARVLIDEIGQVGTLTVRESKQKDLTPGIKELEKNIDVLAAKEKELLEQLASQTNPEEATNELAKVREQINDLHSELASLNKNMMMSTIELVINDLKNPSSTEE